MFLRIRTLVRKEVIQLTRDWLLTAFVLLLPILQLTLLAQATGKRVSDLRVAVLDMDRSAITRQLITDLDNREELNVLYYVENRAQLQALIDQGQAAVAVIFPQGVARDLADPARSAQVQVMIDASSSVIGSYAKGAIQAVFTEYGQRQLQELGIKPTALVDLEVVTYYNPAYDTRQFTVPAQLGFITYQITMTVASLGLARERELGTLEQLIVTPLSRFELVLGKAVPAFMIGVINFLLLLGVAVHIFGVPLRGSFLLLFAMTVLFIITEIGWGVLLSAFSRTQQQAILFVFIMAMIDISFSGYMVPVRNLPGFLQVLARVVPMYHYLTVVRGVMLKGATIATLWPHAVALAGLGLATLGISVRGVNQRLD